MRFIGLWMMAAIAWAIPGADWARAAEPVNIRIVWYVVPYGVTPLLFQLPDVMTHVGKSYTVEFVHLASGSSLPQALASGDVDLGPMSALPLAAAIQNAGMSDIRLLSDEYEDGVDGYWSGRFVVLKDGPIKTVEDLKGKVVASLGIGSSGDMAVRFMLRKHGLEANRDYTSLEASAGNMPAMLVAGKVDLINTTGLTARDALVVAKTRVLFDRREVFGGPTQEGTFSARAGFLAKNRAAIVDYMEDYLRALRWFADPAHHDEAVKRLAAFTKAPASQFDWFFTSGDEYRDLNGLPNLPALQKSIDVLADFGLIKPGLDIAKYADLSIVQEAAARLQSAPKP